MGVTDHDYFVKVIFWADVTTLMVISAQNRDGRRRETPHHLRHLRRPRRPHTAPYTRPPVGRHTTGGLDKSGERENLAETLALQT
ncbi:hypothetical protein ALMA_0975 [Alloscardovia macacae]|uniref:Uncharacterized protein n=1 Tax=Alloscardovia macacae TaxID=1160091 RepID=A0A261F5Z2_9BIFI|nr:hypothetical protein ALMA_0975 [Alloscardovia macacae]